MDRLEIAPLVTLPRPFDPHGGRAHFAAFLPGETLGAYVSRCGVELPKSAFIVLHNGCIVPHAMWPRLIPRPGDQILIRAVPQGGGGGSKVLRTVAMVALVIASVKLPLLMGLTETVAGVTTLSTAGMLTSAAIMIGGSLVINALLPLPTPTAAQLGTGQKYESSPTYSLSGGRNRPRPWEPMALIFGRHKIVPDYGSKYYTERVGDDLYMNQIFHFGLQAGSVALSDFKIGQTPISNYQGVQIQISGEDGKLSMFPGNVDTLQGFGLASGVVNSRTTPIDTTYISVELAAQLFGVSDDGSIYGQTVDLRIQYRPVGGGAWTDIGLLSDAIYATHYWALEQKYGAPSGDTGWQEWWEQISYGSTNPADHVNGQEFEISPAHGTGEYWDPYVPARIGRWSWKPHPYQQGRPWYGIAPDPVIGYSTSPGVRIYGARREATYRTVGWAVPKGQYEVRIWKVTGDISDSRASNETAVAQILCFQEDAADYSGQLRVALRIKASSQLQGAVDEFSAIAEAFCPTWDGEKWAWAHSRNPADWLLWFARGKIGPKGRVYGGGLSDSRIEIDDISAWAAWCKTKNLTFDYVLDRQMGYEAVLQMIARAGRASISRATGKLGVVWDAADIPVTAVFGPFNMRAGSFSVAYTADNLPDEVIVNYPNQDADWQMDEVRVAVPGATTTINPLQIDLEGCTRTEMAGREANLIAASQVFHRRRVSWECNIEGHVASRGQVVRVSHDLTVWGYSGRLISRTGNQITLSQRIPIGSGIMLLRDPEGKMKVVNVTGPAEETDTVTITTDLSGGEDEDPFPLPGDEGFEGVPALDWAWQFDPLETPGRRLKIVDVQPARNYGVKFVAVDDDPGYYTPYTNPYTHAPPRDGALLAGQVFAITFAEGWYNTLSKTLDMTATWSLSVSVPVDVTVTINGVQQAAVRVSDTRSLKIPDLRRGDVVSVNVAPVSITGRGKPLTEAHTVAGVASAPSALTSLTATPEGNLLRLRWSVAPEPDVVDYEVRPTDSNWGATGALFVGDATTCTVDPDLGTYYVRSVNAEGLYSTASASVTFTPGEVPDVSAIDEKFQDTSLTNATITLSWPGVSPQFGLRGYRVTYEGETQDVDATKVTLPADWLGTRVFEVRVIDGRGVVSAGTQKAITKLAPASPQGVFTRVIDNVVTLYWTIPAPTTLPYAYTLIKKGATWESAEVIGRVDSGFATQFEFEAGLYTYWLAIVDTDDNESAPVSIVANVSEPPDFVFQGELFSAFDGAKTSAIVDAGALLLPVDTGRTWQAHFSDRSWASPSAQVSAGFPLYAQPTPTPGTYQEVFDFGNTVPSSRAALVLDAQTIAGSPLVETTIETSADGSTWSAPTAGTEVFALNFRYVRVTLTVSQSGTETALVRVNAMSVRLSTKLKNDGGQTTASASDALGTIANFNVNFLDVASITATPSGTVPRQAVCDFKDTVMSGTFSVSAGVVTVNITAHGLIAGQDVTLNFPDGPERVTIATASTDSFTAPTTHTGSGSLTAYPQSMRIYLFDKDGVRQSGLVYWSIRGN